jgi:hypothetical protein
MDDNPYQSPQETGIKPDDEFTPRIPRIYHEMADGKIPIWLGMLIVRLSWVFLMIPALVLTLPVWGSVTVVQWLRGKPPGLSKKQRAAVQREWDAERARRDTMRQ